MMLRVFRWPTDVSGKRLQPSNVSLALFLVYIRVYDAMVSTLVAKYSKRGFQRWVRREAFNTGWSFVGVSPLVETIHSEGFDICHKLYEARLLKPVFDFLGAGVFPRGSILHVGEPGVRTGDAPAKKINFKPQTLSLQPSTPNPKL